MKKIAIALSLFLTGITSGYAQDISAVFKTMPDNIIFGLETAEKDLLLSNVKDTAQVVVENKLYSEIKRLAISPDFLSIQTSQAGTTQIKLLPLINDSKIICVVKTASGKFTDSQIRFYTTKWIPILQSELFPKREINWFIKTDADRESQDFENAYAALDTNPMKITLSANDQSISVEYDIKNYLSKDDYTEIEPFLTGQPKVLNWDKSSFK